MVVASIFVLYSNDAVEVRYSDGSRLQLSPCGSSMCHQRSSNVPQPELDDDIINAPMAQKWTQFVTSEHRDKVVQALDFRNRFADRPFLPSSLLSHEEIMVLYDNINFAVWPTCVKEANIRVNDDGSRTLFSNDKRSSIVLSPHGRDFTVQYLSRISDHNSDIRVMSSIDDFEQLKPIDCKNDGEGTSHFFGYNLSSHVSRTHGTGSVPQGSMEDTIISDSEQYRSQNIATSICCAVRSLHCDDVPKYDIDAIVPSGRMVSQPDYDSWHEEVAPSTLDYVEQRCWHGGVSGTDCPGNASATMESISHRDFPVSAFCHDVSTISRISTPDGFRGDVDCDITLQVVTTETAPSIESVKPVNILHSSPVNSDGIASISANHDRSSNCLFSTFAHDAMQSSEGISQDDSRQNDDGQPVDTNVSEAIKHGNCVAENEVLLMNTEGANHRLKNMKNCETSITPIISYDLSLKSCAGSLTGDHTSHVVTGDLSTSDCASNPSTDMEVELSVLKSCEDSVFRQKADVGGGIQQQYTWVTRHMLCNECPSIWTYPLSMLQQADRSKYTQVTDHNYPSGHLERLQAVQRPQFQLNEICSQFPDSLPICCPFQHLHIWQRQDFSGSDASDQIEFKHGEFKVIMIEGVIYRFMDLVNMKVIEIYPGDGSVIVSQGSRAHFFSHFFLANEELREKVYSVKLLSNDPRLQCYVGTLIKRGKRFLSAMECPSTKSYNKDPPCWQRTSTQVIEPKLTSMLEGCCVPNIGRFTAFTDGRVRVLFDDRTALDTAADFSCVARCSKPRNIPEAEVHEGVAMSLIRKYDQQLSYNHGRLLLPNGKYEMVNLESPGKYRWYTEMVKEWITWVKSSSNERSLFYRKQNVFYKSHLSVAAEFKKIECFNYIADSGGSGNGSDFRRQCSLPKGKAHLLSTDEESLDLFRRHRFTPEIVSKTCGQGKQHQMELGQRYSCPSKLDFGHTSVTPRSGSVQHNSIFNLSEGAPVETSAADLRSQPINFWQMMYQEKAHNPGKIEIIFSRPYDQYVVP